MQHHQPMAQTLTSSSIAWCGLVPIRQDLQHLERFVKGAPTLRQKIFIKFLSRRRFSRRKTLKCLKTFLIIWGEKLNRARKKSNMTLTYEIFWLTIPQNLNLQYPDSRELELDRAYIFGLWAKTGSSIRAWSFIKLSKFSFQAYWAFPILQA